MNSSESACVYVFSGFALDPGQRSLRAPDGAPVPLGGRAFDALLLLVEHGGELVEKSTLIKKLWPHVVVEDNNLAQTISGLRQALGEKGGSARFIETVPGRGYQFVASVRRLPATTAAVPAAEAPRPAAAAGAAAGVHQRSWLRWAAAALLAIVAAGGAWWWAAREHSAATPTTAPPAGIPAAPARPRIAVLPLENLSSDPDDAFFADGMHEQILTTLANSVSGLDVISRTTMDTYRGRPVTARALASELDCTYVLEGSVRRDGRQMRLSLQLIDARNDRHLWAQDYDRELVRIVALESEVAAAVASQLSLRIAGGAFGPAATTDPVAFDYYLRARVAEHSGGPPLSADEFRRIGSLLDQAIALDPSFARAYVERIGLHVTMFLQNYDASEARLAAARRDLEAVRKLAPRDPLTSFAEALLSFAEMDYARSLQWFTAAESAGLYEPQVLNWKSALLYAMGRKQEAAALDRRFLALDPKNSVAQRQWWTILMELHQGPDAMRVANLGIAREGTDSPWPFFRAAVYFYAGGDGVPLAAFIGNEPPEFRMAFIDSYQIVHRYADAREIIDRNAAETWRWDNFYLPLYRVGLTPVADRRGWLDLLLGDTAGARRDGQRILGFLNRSPETRWNRWYRRLLRADAQLFMGSGAEAVKTAHEAEAITRGSADVSDQINALVGATMIMAWAGARDAAALRLEQMSADRPGIWPGEVTGNPIWSVPLAGNARYEALRARLVAQMKATRLE